MNTITINGETITTYGNNVVVRNGKVTVDGEVIKEFTGTIICESLYWIGTKTAKRKSSKLQIRGRIKEWR